MASRDRETAPIISDSDLDVMVEHCDKCDRETDHAVEIQIMDTARRETAQKKYSREPCRVSRCRDCGEQTVMLMNHV